MLKKILKGLFIVFFIFVGVGVYFYIFPKYPDYNIPESYFETRFQKEGFESEKNGFYEWKKLLESLNQHEEIITEFDTYYKCYFENTCFKNLENLSEVQKEEELKKFLENQEKMQEFGEITNDFLKQFEEITQKYEFISTLNYANDENGHYPFGAEIIQYTKLMNLNGGMLFYAHFVANQKEKLSIFTLINKNLSWLSYKLDDAMIGYMVIIKLYKNYFEYFEKNVNQINNVEKRLLLNNLKTYSISNDMLENSEKSYYLYGKIVYEGVHSQSISNIHSVGYTNIKNILFWDINETINLFKKSSYESIGGNCNFKIKVNGKNFIGRTLLQTRLCMNPQFKKQSDLLQKREELIQLLSN